MRVPFFLRLNGITRGDRREMISRAKEAILKGGGFIVDFHMFSNLSICLNFELPARKIRDLEAALREAEQLQAEVCASEVTGTLEITFIHNEPDLRIEVPPIPG